MVVYQRRPVNLTFLLFQLLITTCISSANNEFNLPENEPIINSKEDMVHKSNSNEQAAYDYYYDEEMDDHNYDSVYSEEESACEASEIYYHRSQQCVPSKCLQGTYRDRDTGLCLKDLRGASSLLRNVIPRR